MMPSSAGLPIELTTDNCYTLPLDRPITLYQTEPEAESQAESQALKPFTATAVQLILIKGAGDRFQECHLILSTSLSQYQRILEQSLFHLKPEVRGPLQQTDFRPDSPILLELGLQPHFFTPVADADVDTPVEEHTPFPSRVTELLAALEKQPSAIAEAEDGASDFLRMLLEELLVDFSFDSGDPSTASPDPGSISPWLKTDSWLCRSVQQRQADQTVGYATLWTYTTPEQADPVMESGTAALDAIATLLQKTTDAVKTEVEQELPQLKQSLSQFSDQLITALEQVDWDAMLTSTEAPSEQSTRPVSEIVKQFFDQDDWTYVQLSDPSVLQLAFQGDAGRWTCLAQSHDEAEQVVFYSICPITAPEASYGAISELLMWANDGMVIGNFELDFSRGEIRYKTSLDVEGDRLTPALMRRLVYPNVQTLDTYLPGILAVLEGRCTPAEAIATIEQPKAFSVEDEE